MTSSPSEETRARVKPLEWIEHWGGADDDLPSWRGKNPLGLHVSVDFIGKYSLSKHSDAPEDELASLKATAQAVYEHRVLSALVSVGWSPIETAPKDRTKVMLWCAMWLHPIMGYWSPTINAWLEYGSRDTKANAATHWQHLPSSPIPHLKAEQEKEER